MLDLTLHDWIEADPERCVADVREVGYTEAVERWHAAAVLQGIMLEGTDDDAARAFEDLEFDPDEDEDEDEDE